MITATTDRTEPPLHFPHISELWSTINGTHGRNQRQTGWNNRDRQAQTDRKQHIHKGRMMSDEVQTSCKHTLITSTLEKWQTDLKPFLTCSTLCGCDSFDVGRCTDYFLVWQNNAARQVLLQHLPESLMNMIILFTVPELQSGWVEISVVQLRLHRSYTRSQYSAFKCSESKDTEHNTEIPRRSRK